ncbi:MAG: UvrD-helicase domain-containing protein [Planctomycetes bacterium]|nr:UvrD-helicase domain-containing protein [Planctomycetota bacterium]
MTDLLKGLNAEQKLAVTTREGPVLVLAGAGSGKTKVITVRMAYLMLWGVKPENILAMTFTNKAAGEMKERVAGLVGKDKAKLLTVGTFHSFCVKLLRAHAAAAGLAPNFTICDASDQIAAVKGALRELRIGEASIQPSVLQGRISLMKNKLMSSDGFLASAADDQDELVGRAWKMYEEHLRRARTVDFDDLLLFTLQLLRTNERVRAELEQRFRYVMVDEYQDTNGPQYEIVRLVAGRHKNLCVVGDDDQSIYGWRGADVTKILSFDKDFRGAKVVRLETNYRSTEPILAAANAVIAHNPDRHAKTLRSAIGKGEDVVMLRGDDEVSEADTVARQIGELVRLTRAQFSDFAVLFRTQTQPRAFEEQFRLRAIPYVLIGGMSFFDRKEVRDVLAYLKLAHNPRDEVAFLRVVNCPPRGIGRGSIDKAVEIATQHGISTVQVFETPELAAELPAATVDAVRAFRNQLSVFAADPGEALVGWMRQLLEAVNYRAEVDRAYLEPKLREERWQGVLEILDLAENHVRRTRKASLSTFLEALTLDAEDSRDDGKVKHKDAVTLMTLHSAKGLEFERVYLVGVEEGILPHARSVAEDTVEEERRLMYVGITRAKRHLTITLTKTRSKYGTRVESHPSRFLYEMKGEKPPKDWKAAGSAAPAVRVTEGGQRTRKKKSSKRSAAVDLPHKDL